MRGMGCGRVVGDGMDELMDGEGLGGECEGGVGKDSRTALRAAKIVIRDLNEVQWWMFLGFWI